MPENTVADKAFLVRLGQEFPAFGELLKEINIDLSARCGYSKDLVRRVACFLALAEQVRVMEEQLSTTAAELEQEFQAHEARSINATPLTGAIQ